MKFSTALIDLDDTLLDFKRSEKIGLQNCHRVFFQKVAPFEVFEKEYTKVNRALWKQVEEGKVSSSFVGKERFRQLSEFFHIPLDAACPLFYEEQLVEHSCWIEGAVDLLEYLKKQEIKIGFLTNGFAHIQHSKYEKHELSLYSSIIVISEEEGYAKPHPEIFRRALSKIGSQAQETLMIGDSLESDGKGAKQSGLGFCWYTKNPEPLDWTPEFVISDLRDLTKLLASA